MNAQIIPFTYTSDSTVRTVIIDGDPWFVLADLCRILDLSNVSVVRSRLDEGVSQAYPLLTPGGMQQMTIVSEAGMYEVVIRSDKPEAAAFRRWITGTVLPEIRKTGSYGVVRALPQTYVEALRALADESEAHEATKVRVAELETPAAAWDRLATSGGDWSVQEAAGILARDPSIAIGRQRLFDHMAASHWVFRQDRHWLAYASAMDSGWLAHRAQHHVHPHTGEIVLDPPQVRVTAKGLARLHRMLGGTSPLVPLGVAS